MRKLWVKHCHCYGQHWRGYVKYCWKTRTRTHTHTHTHTQSELQLTSLKETMWKLWMKHCRCWIAYLRAESQYTEHDKEQYGPQRWHGHLCYGFRVDNEGQPWTCELKEEEGGEGINTAGSIAEAISWVKQIIARWNTNLYLQVQIRHSGEWTKLYQSYTVSHWIIWNSFRRVGRWKTHCITVTNITKSIIYLALI